MKPFSILNNVGRSYYGLLYFLPFILLLPTKSIAQERSATWPSTPSILSDRPIQEIFPDALNGMELYYKTGWFGEVELTLKKYFSSQADIANSPEKLMVRESITGMVAAQPLLQLQSVKIDTGIVNVRCAGYTGAYVKVATYKAKVGLRSPMMGGYDVTLGYCCWDQHTNMVNIQGMREGKKQGTSLNLHIPEIASSDSNSSPVFQFTPVLTTCIDQLVSFYASGYDADRDSLSYAFCSIDDYMPEDGSDNPAAPVMRPEQMLNVTFPGARPPFRPVAFASGYDFSSPMKGKQMVIDDRTGMVTMKPEAVGDYLVGISVKEFRNGKLLGTYKRVIKIKVVS